MEGQHLRFFAEEGSLRDQEGEFDLSLVKRIVPKTSEDDPTKNYYPFEFELSDGDNHLFATESRGDRDNWISSLNTAKQQYWDRLMSTRFDPRSLQSIRIERSNKRLVK